MTGAEARYYAHVERCSAVEIALAFGVGVGRVRYLLSVKPPLSARSFVVRRRGRKGLKLRPWQMKAGAFRVYLLNQVPATSSAPLRWSL